jgi:signal transduction histidine kinase
MTMNRISYQILIIVALTLLIIYLHFGTMAQFSSRVVLDELYYLPLLLGVLWFGLKGVLVTWVLVSAAYLPFFSGIWTTTFPEVMDRVLHLVFTGVFTVVAYLLAERERTNREQAEQGRYLAVIGQVATVIVHDLKNPLISILGFARRIREGKGDIAQAARTIEDSAQTMERIVNSVLDFAKPLHLEFIDVDLRDSVRKASEFCRTKADARRVTLTTNLPSAQITAKIDCSYMERALINLIDNAIEASPHGAQVTITGVTDRDGVVITISDQGSGMDRETLATLFMPFFTTKAEGTGLGMPIAKKVIEAHDGTLDISSTVGVGTEATVRLSCNQRV